MTAQLSEELVWSQIVAKSWCDGEFKQRLLSDTRAVLAEHDLEVPLGMEIEVVEGDEVKVNGTSKVRRFVMPSKPPNELSDDELVGEVWAYCYCAACARCGGCGCRCRCRC
jgi:hypothetical protein